VWVSRKKIIATTSESLESIEHDKPFEQHN
jgi:hypothetical protein